MTTVSAEHAVTSAEPVPVKEFTLSIDTGGTFTDGFVSGAGRHAQVKVDTTPHDLTEGFMACVQAAAAAMGEDLEGFLGKLGVVHFSSTIATNTAVQRSGPQVGLIVSGGADRAYGTSEQFSALGAFISADMIVSVPEAVDDTGQVITEPDARSVDDAVRFLLEQGTAMIVVSFGNAHLNPSNEQRARDLITASYPRHYLGAIPVLQASRISIAPDDFGRTATAVLNAYLHPALVRSLYKAEDGLRRGGYQRPLLIVNTDGSSTRVAKTRALDTFNSGPSAGVLGAVHVASALAADNVCTFDVGGTTTDVAFIAGAVAPLTPETLAADLSVPHPAVDLWSFGLGGGSIIARTESGLTVGPGSAGSSPGPACFGLGGTNATPTDVWLTLGYIDADRFLGGRRVLLKDESIAAIERLFGPDDERDLEEKALDALDAVHQALGEGMRDWADRHPGIRNGPDRWLFSYGGGGGLLAVAAAESLGIQRVVVFPQSSVFSAFGGGLLPIAHNYRAALVGSRMDDVVAKLAASAVRDLRAEGVTELAAVAALLRTASQEGDFGQTAAATLADLLEGTSSLELPADATRVELRVEVERPRELAVRMGPEADNRDSRTVSTRGGLAAYPIVSGLGEPDAPSVQGPVFLSARDTTIIVPAGWSCSFTELGYGIIQKEEAA
ncbi:MAG: 5-oxoprolinase [Naasia sp.]|jgi:N-methylhydantoinase A|uniref:hydantoinase/oxoprolinase family protein n=1 Tax=Naasia sp. TaxID=2546198 RepID=UPI00260F2720|nr:hydantoinase/oxoprolinase family protein [Naasia sp.]MCU1570433.1 5-oxoprolinase [Naasia sp.]